MQSIGGFVTCAKSQFEIVEQRLMLMGENGKRVSIPIEAVASTPFNAIFPMEETVPS